MSWFHTLIDRFFGRKAAEERRSRAEKKAKMALEEEQKAVAERFQARFGITFANSELIIRALKHRAYLSQTGEPRVNSNERLEFLGDAVLDLVVTHYLFQQFPQKTEGSLSKMKSILVSKPVLADVGVEHEMGELILLNRGEEKTGGRQRKSIVADAFEAIIGAIYLDQGIEAASTFIHTYLLENTREILEAGLYRNFKSTLLEYAQGEGNGLPEYRVIEERGPDHAKEFLIEVWLSEECLGRGHGKSKKIAEQEAAKQAVKKLKLDDEG
ncbi:MAG TPA: ribonuclease III [Calditrichia bacterium]|nr:ribonuclease III [Calditrichia bacterium]